MAKDDRMPKLFMGHENGNRAGVESLSGPFFSNVGAQRGKPRAG
jgi:hypothetical protein